MFTDIFNEVIKNEGVVSIVSWADGEAHVVNTWNSYLIIPEDGKLLIPAWKMRKTEANTLKNNKVLVTLGSKEVQGLIGPGTGFLLEGTAVFKKSGPEFDAIKEKYSFATRALEITVSSVKQTI